MKQGRDEEAAQILENVLEWCPVNRFYGNQLLGTVYRRLGRLEEAQRVLLSSQGREVVWPDQWMNEISSFHRGAGWKIELPMQLLGRGRTDEAIQMLRQFLQTESDNPILLSNLAIAYRTNGDLDRSIELLKQAIDLREHYHQAHFNLGLAYLLVAEEADTAGDTQRAEAYTDYALHHASFALEVNPSYYSGHGLMGQVRERLGEFDQSLEEYRIAAKDFQTGVFWLGLRSALLTKLQRWPELADVLVHMLDRFPPQPQTMYDLALAQLKAGRGELAIQTVDRFGQLWPDDARVVQLHQAVQTARQAGPARPRSGVPQ